VPTIKEYIMKRILIIEDDPLVADVYRNRLRNEGFAVDVATDGPSGLESFNKCRPDLVFLDLMLPQLSGVELLKTIRAHFSPRELPVFVFTNAYLGGIMQQAWEAGANQVVPKAGIGPKAVVQMIRNALDNPPPAATDSDERKTDLETKIRKQFLELAPQKLQSMWEPLRALAADPDNAEHLHCLSGKIRPLSAAATVAGLHSIAHLAGALEALFKDLCDKPQRLTPSVVLTMAQALDTLKFLLAHPLRAALKPPVAGRVLVVDDDEFTRQAVIAALARVNLKTSGLANPVSALKRRTGKRFDLILLDIEMPDASGFDLCGRLRAMPAFRDTPIIFLSMHAGIEHRTESALCGGDDYITKPFFYMELAVKALCFVMRGTSAHAKQRKGPNGEGPESVFSRRDLNMLKQAILSSFDKKPR
jgi:DNA-binding response OmpR family regulator